MSYTQKILPADGEDVRVDDTTGGNIQAVKLADGTEDSTTPINAGTGTATNALRTVTASDSPDVTALSAIQTAIQLLDNAVSGNELQVDVLTLPALAAGTNNIGDVDVLTVPADPFGTNADAAATAGGTGSMQAKLRLATSQLNSIITELQNVTNAEDSVHASGDTGVMFLGVRKDVAGTLASADGDYTPPQFDSSGNLRVTGSSGVTEYAEGATDASITGVAMLWEDAADTLRVPSAANPLPMEMVAGSLTLDGEAHIGEVGGSTVIITPTITVTAGAYSANDVVGGEITLTNAMRVSSGSGVIQSLTVQTADGETPALIFMFYDSNPAANLADNAAFAWGSGDIGRWLGHVTVAASDYATQGGDGIATKTGIGLPVAASGSQNLFMYIICTGTPTFSATTDLTVRVGILQD